MTTQPHPAYSSDHPQTGRPPTPAGWYEQPGTGLRYWDGSGWIDTPPPPGADIISGASTALGRQPGVYWLALLSAVLLVVGSFGPWATALNIVSISGTHGDGWIVIAIAAFAIAMLWRHAKTGTRGSVVWVILAGIGSAIIGLVDRSDIAHKGSGDLLGQHVTLVRPAWGIYMVIGAAIALAATGWALFRGSGTRRVDADPVNDA
jgi:hypothetical protein